MNRFFMGMLFAFSLLGFAGCTSYTADANGEEDLHEKCLKEPNLPICQENRNDDEREDDLPTLDEEF